MTYLVDVTLDGSGLFGQIGPFYSAAQAEKMRDRVVRHCRRQGMTVVGNEPNHPGYEIQVDIVEIWSPAEWRQAVPE